MPDAPAPAPAAPADAPATAPAPARSRVSVPSVLVLAFMLFVLTNRGPGDELARGARLHALAQMGWQRGNYSDWLHFGNATDNFTLPETHPATTPLVHSFLDLNGTLDPAVSSYHTNVSGYFRGDAIVHDLFAPPADAPWAGPAAALVHAQNASLATARRGTWNWTAADRVALIAVDRTVPLEDEVAIVHGRIEVADSRRDDELVFFFEAVHFIANGTLYGLAEPNRIRPDLRDLPALVPAAWRNTTGRVVEAELGARIDKALAMLESGAYDSASEEYPSDDEPEARCAFELYAQLAPATGVPAALMRTLEAEDAAPAGLRGALPRTPLRLRGALLSARCGLLLALPGVDGVSSRAWYRKVTSYAGFTALVHLALAVLLSRQVARSRTPAGLSRLSRWTFLAQAMVDAVSFAGHVTFSILAEGHAAVSLLAPAFLAGLLFAYEMQFAMWIAHYQAPENVVVAPPAPTPTPAPAPAADEAADEAAVPLLAAEEGGAPTYPPPAAPAPAPAPTPPAAPAQPSLAQLYVDHLRTDPQARTYLVMSVLIVGALQLALAPGVGFALAGALHGALWLPALVRGAARGRSAGLGAEYLLGTTLGRMAYLLYLLACPHNILDAPPRHWVWAVGAAMLAQAGALRAQEPDALGPAFFVPRAWRVAAPAHDWHPHLASDAEAGALGDCAICMDAIEAEDEEAEDGAGGGLVGRAKMARKQAGYALAPCQHLFHTACLERWLAIKNICPQCRRPLPTL